MTLMLMLQEGFHPIAAAFRGGFIGVGTLLILFAMSIGSWAAFLSRRAAVLRMEQSSRDARESFLDASDTAAFAERCKGLPPGPVTRMFLEAHEHHEDLMRALVRKGGNLDVARVQAGRELLTRTLAGARSRELSHARRGLVLLATIGATAPFVGLFGTVWGVVKSFASIGMAKSADLAVVAPGISEALVATAAGLVAAVPAVWFYNSLAARVRHLGGELDRFAIDVLNVYDRAVATGVETERAG